MKKFYLLTALFLPLSLMAYHHEVNETSPKELVSQAYETFAAGDSTAWAKLHTADLSFTVFGDLPQSGIHLRFCFSEVIYTLFNYLFWYTCCFSVYFHPRLDRSFFCST